MKYLRIFEEFGEMYEPISVSEFGYNPNKKIPFTLKELEQVVELIEDKGYKLTFREDFENNTAWDDKDVVLLRFEKIMDHSRKTFYGTPIPGTKKCRLIVYKIEDDYFPICLRDLEMNNRLIDETFYKCDQFEGLVNFIKEKL
jgi:hypothetical protein